MAKRIKGEVDSIGRAVDKLQAEIARIDGRAPNSQHFIVHAKAGKASLESIAGRELRAHGHQPPSSPPNPDRADHLRLRDESRAYAATAKALADEHEVEADRQVTLGNDEASQYHQGMASIHRFKQCQSEFRAREHALSAQKAKK